MRIEVEDYYLDQDGGGRFDLYWNKQINERKFKVDENGVRTRETTENLTTTLVCLGYSMTLEKCFRRMIINELEQKNITVTFEEFLKEYKEVEERFEKQLKTVNHINW